MNLFSSLFLHSSFFCLSKDNEQSALLIDLQNRLQYKNIDHFHPSRQKEFLLGRVCASKAFELYFGSELLNLPTRADRSPAWPDEVIGSISHNQKFVGAAVSSGQKLLGIGIDFEVIGRAKLELNRYIRNKEDIDSHPSLNPNELLTIIFSAKESLYKALYPKVNCFFGFEAAALKDIDVLNGTFQIELIKDISPIYGPKSRFHFEGRFKIVEGSCLTVLEIPF
jgi:enterobactin synthetase component D